MNAVVEFPSASPPPPSTSEIRAVLAAGPVRDADAGAFDPLRQPEELSEEKMRHTFKCPDGLNINWPHPARRSKGGAVFPHTRTCCVHEETVLLPLLLLPLEWRLV